MLFIEYIFIPVHRLRCFIFEPQNQVYVVMYIFGRNITWEFRNSTKHSLNITDRNWNDKNKIKLLMYFDKTKYRDCCTRAANIST